MTENMSHIILEKKPLSYVAQSQIYAPRNSDAANPVIINRELKIGELDNSTRGWRSQPTISGICFYPYAPSKQPEQAFTLGNRMISHGLGWENYDIEHIPIPSGYAEWGTIILAKHSFNLRGDGEGMDFIYGAIYCSLLGQYSISPSLLKSLLERWNPDSNTFLFHDGERTVTLLDLHYIMGLPVDGEFYEEYVPSHHEREPSMLLYPKCLSQLLEVWDELQVGGEVSLQEWCDCFHNGPRGLSHSDDMELSLIYKAAFIAIWLCGFAIIGGGPRIRRGVLVMASWIALGRRFALAQPALCSLYYSLRLISTDPVGPSYMKRPWPVHYLIGWMGVYLKHAFVNKVTKPRIPYYDHPTRKPMLVNMLFRTSKHFNPESASDFLRKDSNILWHPYKPHSANHLRTPPSSWISKIFCLCIRRGLLPFRRDNICIAEPYHPDRVTRQFRLDQIVPYLVLKSVYTEDDFGVAYSYWAHLLRPINQDFSCLPNETRIGSCTIYWINWYRKFSEPFISVLTNLRCGCARGRVHYNDRKRLAAGKIIPRRLSPSDFVVIREVREEQHTKYIAFIKAREEVIISPWKKILHDFLRTRANTSTLPDNVRFTFYSLLYIPGSIHTYHCS